MKKIPTFKRRRFLASLTCLSTGILSFAGATHKASGATTNLNDSVFVIGPMEGYSPQIGTIVSMLNYNRYTIERIVANMTQEQLDYLHDKNSNTIGGMLLHLGATEKFYQINTFEGRENYNDEEKKVWGAAMALGDQGRKNIKGKELQHYLDAITEVRQYTLDQLKTKDDEWLLAIDPKWSTERPLNTYWKWFHVCEHEANHRGQISWLKSRLPGAKPSGD